MRSIVIAPANTGSERRSRITVRNTAHTNSGIRSNRIPLVRMFRTVEMKFTAPRIEDAPAR